MISFWPVPQVLNVKEHSNGPVLFVDDKVEFSQFDQWSYAWELRFMRSIEFDDLVHLGLGHIRRV